MPSVWHSGPLVYWTVATERKLAYICAWKREQRHPGCGALDEFHARYPRERRCKKCGALSPEKRGRLTCRSCQNADGRAWAKANPEKRLTWGRKWSAANRDTLNERARTRRAVDPSRKKAADAKWYSINRESSLARSSKWAKDNPEKNAIRSKRRRSRLAGSIGDLTVAEWRAIVAKQKNRCAACGKRKKLTMDHIVPLYHGGSSYAHNIQGLCLRCNSAKRARLDAGTQGDLFAKTA